MFGIHTFRRLSHHRIKQIPCLLTGKYSTMSLRNISVPYFKKVQPSILCNDGTISGIPNKHFCIQQIRCSGSVRMTAEDIKNPHKKTPPEFSPGEKHKKFQTIYYFKFIVPMKMFSWIKFYTSGLTVFLVPYSVLMYTVQLMPTEAIVGLFCSSALISVSLFAVTPFLQKVVGIIGVNEQNTEIRISHLTFWGKRVNHVYNLEDVVNFSASGEDMSRDIYKKLTFYTNDQEYYVFNKGGIIMDEHRFRSILGHL